MGSIGSSAVVVAVALSAVSGAEAGSLRTRQAWLESQALSAGFSLENVAAVPDPGSGKALKDTAIVIPVEALAGFKADDAAGNADDYPLGRGFYTLPGVGAGYCVYPPGATESPLTKVLATGGREELFYVDRVEDLKTLSQQIGVSASASANWLIGSASAKLDFMNSIESSSYGLSLLAKVNIKLPRQELGWPKLINDDHNGSKVDLLKTPGAFLQSCGDRYISGQLMGGEMYAIIHIDAHSEEEKQSIDSSLGGGFGFFSGEAEFKQKLSQATKSNHTTILAYRSGGSGKTFQVTADELLKQVADFTTDLNSGNGSIVGLELSEYSNTLNYPASTDLANYDDQRDILEKMGAQGLAFLQETSNIEYILKNRGEFGDLSDADVTQLKDAEATLSSELDTLKDEVRLCVRHSRCTYDASLKVPPYKKPKWLKPQPAPPPQPGPTPKPPSPPMYTTNTCTATFTDTYKGQATSCGCSGTLGAAGLVTSSPQTAYTGTCAFIPCVPLSPYNPSGPQGCRCEGAAVAATISCTAANTKL